LSNTRNNGNSHESTRPPTIIDLARESGVSKSTVSRVLNGNLNVSESARSLVVAAMDKLDYQMNSAARSLRTERSHLVGLVMPGIKHVFYSTTAEVLEREFQKVGISLLIASSGGSADGEVLAINSLRSHGADAFVLSLINENDERTLATLKSIRQQILLLDRDIPEVFGDKVLIDPRRGVGEAVEHLTGLGHSKIGLITHGTFVRPGREVKASFEQALENYGLYPSAEVLLEFEDVGAQIGWTAAEAVLKTGTTAILCLGPSSVTAGVLNYLTWNGMRIPDDISIVVYDETELSSAMKPGLTAIVRPLEEYACLASNLVISRFSDPDSEQRILTVPTQLMVRDSTGRVNNKVASVKRKQRQPATTL